MSHLYTTAGVVTRRQALALGIAGVTTLTFADNSVIICPISKCGHARNCFGAREGGRHSKRAGARAPVRRFLRPN